MAFVTWTNPQPPNVAVGTDYVGMYENFGVTECQRRWPGLVRVLPLKPGYEFWLSVGGQVRWLDRNDKVDMERFKKNKYAYPLQNYEFW